MRGEAGLVIKTIQLIEFKVLWGHQAPYSVSCMAVWIIGSIICTKDHLTPCQNLRRWLLGKQRSVYEWDRKFLEKSRLSWETRNMPGTIGQGVKQCRPSVRCRRHIRDVRVLMSVLATSPQCGMGGEHWDRRGGLGGIQAGMLFLCFVKT